MAMLRVVPESDAMDEIIDHVTLLTLDDPLRFWILAAAAGWSGPGVAAFVAECARSSRSDLCEAAALVQAGTYDVWRPP